MFGLLQHEAKLSVLNFGVRKAAALEEPLPNKAPLLLVTGIRRSTPLFRRQLCHWLCRDHCLRSPFRADMPGLLQHCAVDMEMPWPYLRS